MTADEAIDLVTRLVCRSRHIDPSQVLAATNLINDLGFDSLDVAGLLAALHKETGVQLDVNSMKDIQTVSDIAKGLSSCRD